MNITNKTVLITGAAGGLGTVASWAFARAGANVLALDHDVDKGKQLLAFGTEESQSVRKRLRFVHADLAQHGMLREQLAALLEQTAGIDVLVNNAATYSAKPFEDYTLEEFQHILRVNVEGALVCVQSVLPAMKRKQYGRIINVLSITLSGGWQHLMPYVTSKGALLGMARSLAREVGQFGITVNCVSPGAFPTDAEKIHPDPEGYQRFILEHQALKRRGRPEDIADAMLFFASDHSSFVTGQTLNVDGGWVMQ